MLRTFASRALFAAALVSVPAVLSAQVRDSTIKRDSSAGRLDVASRPTLTTVMTALTMLDSTTARLGGATSIDADSIMLVDVTPLVAASDSATFSAALLANEEGLVALRSAVDKNMTLQGKLAARQVTAAQVIAIELSPSGRGAWVFYRPEQR
ncbi:MAG TPA: hypothetical protein VE869_00500 [Gemmatimonas sp.]|nr:hypothetical protein [Gemmatimonas sp.]